MFVLPPLVLPLEDDPLEPTTVDGTSAFPAFVSLAIVLIGVLVAAGVVLAVVGAARRRGALRRAGLNPYLTGDEQIAARLAAADRSPGAGPRRSLEERLAELDDLLRREVISAEEHARARAQVLSQG